MANTRAVIPRWYVLRDASRVVLLENPRQEDMFWWSYEVTALEGGHGDVFATDFWEQPIQVEDADSGYRFSRVLAGKVRPARAGDRVWLRGFNPYLTLSVAPTSWVERLLRAFGKGKGK